MNFTIERNNWSAKGDGIKEVVGIQFMHQGEIKGKPAVGGSD